MVTHAVARALVSDLLGGTRVSQENPSWLQALLRGEAKLSNGLRGSVFFPLSWESCFTPLLFLYLFCIFQVLHSSCKHHLKINFP